MNPIREITDKQINRQTDKTLGPVMTTLCSRHTNGWTDATKYVISLALWSIIITTNIFLTLCIYSTSEDIFYTHCYDLTLIGYDLHYGTHD